MGMPQMLASRSGPADVCLKVEMEVLVRDECPDRVFYLCRVPGNKLTAFVTYEADRIRPTECYHGHWFETFFNAVRDFESRTRKLWWDQLTNHPITGRPYMGPPNCDKQGFAINPI